MTNKLTKIMMLLGALTVASAATAQTAMPVTASIASACSVGNATTLTFGALEILNGAAPSTTDSASTGGGTFDAVCTNGPQSPEFRFTSANTWFNDHRLKGQDGLTYIEYKLFNSTGGFLFYGYQYALPGFVANGTTQQLRIQSTIAAAAKLSKPAQTYTDTITVNVLFTP